MTTDHVTHQTTTWQQSAHFWVGHSGATTHEWIAGCPYGSSLFAFSELYGVDVCILLPCKRWGCVHCGPVRVADLSRRIDLAHPTKFLTLTVNNAVYDSPRHAYDSTRRAVSKFSTRVRRIVGDFEYVRILEVTEKGYPHYHFLARSKYIPQATISTIWAELTGAPIVDIRRVDPRSSVPRYVVKYLTKQLYCPFTTRRVAWSKHFFPPARKVDRDRWQLTNKRRTQSSPVWAMWDQWAVCDLHRLGPYAFTNCSYDRWLQLDAEHHFYRPMPTVEPPPADLFSETSEFV